MPYYISYDEKNKNRKVSAENFLGAVAQSKFLLKFKKIENVCIYNDKNLYCFYQKMVYKNELKHLKKENVGYVSKGFDLYFLMPEKMKYYECELYIYDTINDGKKEYLCKPLKITEGKFIEIFNLLKLKYPKDKNTYKIVDTVTQEEYFIGTPTKIYNTGII